MGGAGDRCQFERKGKINAQLEGCEWRGGVMFIPQVDVKG
jgi:hypothetical protein